MAIPRIPIRADNHNDSGWKMNEYTMEENMKSTVKPQEPSCENCIHQCQVKNIWTITKCLQYTEKNK